MKLNNKKVAVGLSGGVDSVITAYLLKEQGYEVIGLTMLLFNNYDKEGNKITPKFIKDAKEVAEKLDIPHYVVDYRDTFKENIKEDFLNEYIKGRTPNPCVKCNKLIKYGKLLESAHSLGAYYLATGHYANIIYDNEINKYRIFRGLSERKDQSYNLHSLSQEQLKHIILPLGKFNSKEEVRELAKEIQPKISKKRDSMGICFIQDGDYIAYIKKHRPNAKTIKSGYFVDLDGKVIGKHEGIINYTIGQKKGLKKYFDKQLCIVGIDADKNQVVLGEDSDAYSRGLIAKDVNFTIYDELTEDIKVNAKICQWGWLLPVTVSGLDDGIVKVTFDKKERAIAPGQAIVFYKGNEIIGGGTIDKVVQD